MPNEQKVDLLFDVPILEKQQKAVLKLIENYNKAVQSVKTITVNVDNSKGSAELAKNLKNLQVIQDDLIKKNILYQSSIKVVNESLKQEAAQQKLATEAALNKAKVDQILMDTKVKEANLNKIKNADLIQQEKELSRQIELERKLQEQMEKKLKQSTKLTQEEKLEAQLILQKVGSYRALDIQLKLLNIRYKDLSGAERSSPTGEKMLKNISDLNKKLKEIDATMGNHQREVGNYSKAWKGVGDDLKSTILQFAGFYTAFEGVKLFFEGSIEEANKAQQATMQLANTLENVGRSDLFATFEKTALDLSNTFEALDDDDIKQVFTKLIDYGKLTEAQINQLTKVIIDYAAKQKVSLPEATDVMTKALEGSAKGLRVYGINVKDAATVTDRFNIIMKDLAPKVRGAEATFERSARGGFAIFQEKLNRIKESFGLFLFDLLKGRKSAGELFDDAKEKTEAYEKSLTPLLKRYDELKAKGQLNKDEQKELQGVIAKIVEIVPQAATEFDKYGVALDINKGKVTAFLEENKKFLQQKEFKAIEETTKRITDAMGRIDNLRKMLKSDLITERVSTGSGVGGAGMEDVQRKKTIEEGQLQLSNLRKAQEQILVDAQLLIDKYGVKLPASIQSAVTAIQTEIGALDAVNQKVGDNKVVGNGDPDADEAKKKREEEAQKRAAEQLRQSLERAAEFRKKSIEELNKYNETELKIQQDKYKQEYTDESRSFADRLDSLTKYYDVSAAIINKNKQGKLDVLKEEKAASLAKATSEKERLAIIEFYKNKEKNIVIESDREMKQIQTDFANETFRITKETNEKNEKEVAEHQKKMKQANDERVQALLDGVEITKNQDAINTMAEYSIRISKATGEERLKLEKELQDKLTLIDSAGSLARLQILEKELRLQKAVLTALGMSTLDIERQITENLRQQSELRKGIRKSEADEADKDNSELLDKILRYEEAADKFVTALVDRRYTIEKNKIQETIDLNDKKTQQEIDNINKSSLTDQEKQNKIAVLNQVNQAKKEQLEYKQRQLDIQRAKFEKANAILQLIASTAVAVMKHGGPTSPLGLTDLAFGLFQLATIVATPIPKFKEGLDYDYEGPGIINDGDKNEAVVRADGSIEFPKQKNKLEWFKKGDRVLPDADLLINQLHQSASGDMLLTYKLREEGDFDELKNVLSGKLDILNSTIRNKPTGYANITRDGFEWGILTADKRIKMLNSHIRF